MIFWQNRHIGLEYAGTGETGMISSERSRQFVSSLLSPEGLMPYYDGLIQGQYKMCLNSSGFRSSAFIMYNSSPNEVTLIFKYVADHSSVYATRARLPGVQVEQLLGRDGGPLEFRVPMTLEGEIDPPQFFVTVTKSSEGGKQIYYERNLGGRLTPLAEPVTFSCGWRPSR